MRRAAGKASQAGSKAAAEAATKRRALMVKMDDGLRKELDVLAIARRKAVQELGLEAICDLLRKHGRPVSLVDALRKSAAEKPGGAQPKAAKRKEAKAR